MIKIFKYLIIALLATLIACEMDDNLNPKGAYEATPETLVPTATEALAKQYNKINVNYNFDRHLAQYLMDVTYVEASRFSFVARKVSDTYWNEYYRDVLKDLKASMEIIDQTAPNPQTNAQKAAILTLEVFSYTNLVETFGNVPYTEALIGETNTTPKYDDAKTIYKEMFTKISTAIELFEESIDACGGPGNSPKFLDSDLLFHGDSDEWLKFAYNYKFIMAMHMIDVEDIDCKKIVEELVPHLYTPSETANFIYNGNYPYVNDIYDEFTVGRRRDYVASNTIIDKLQSLNDPRIDLFFTIGSAADGHIGKVFGKKTDAKKFSNYSRLTSKMLNDPSFPIVLADGVQISFLLAEAAERGYNVPKSAAEYYRDGIEASILNWGGTQAEVDEYLEQETVAYETAEGDWKQKIGTQAWIALFNRGHEAWTEWRRLDYPIFNVPEEMSYSDLPTRYPYPFDENNMNPDNYAQAAAAIGGDKATTKLFWDKY